MKRGNICRFQLLLITSVLLSSLGMHLTHFSFKHELIKSDGSGYYAYLPALILHQDASYQQVLRDEAQAFEGREYQTYIIEHKNGAKVNKYFPGVAVLQAPFFILASGVAVLTGHEVNGFTSPYFWSLLLGSIFYAVLALLLLFRILRSLNISPPQATIALLLLFFGTQMFYNTLALPAFSHNYSFFLFACLIWLCLRYDESPSIKRAFWVGAVIGLIFLVRPTNVIMVFFIPFIMTHKNRLKPFIKRIFRLSNGELCIALLAFLIISSILPVLWFWQTGSWWVWSYNGEGFAFADPHFWETIFGYRIGLIWHTPLFMLVMIAVGMLLFRKHTAYLFWVGYFVLLTYITSSWWCWDYESNFGHRAYTEHFIILLFPLTHLLTFKWKKIALPLLLLAVAYNGMRFYQLRTGIFPTQRFTYATYTKSLLDFSSDGEPRYYFNRHCSPLGEVVKVDTMRYASNQTSPLTGGAEFTPALIRELDAHPTTHRFVLEASFDKRLPSVTDNWQKIWLVVDASNSSNGRRIYQAIPTYQFFREAQGYWHHTTIEHEVPLAFEHMDQLSVYFWNPQKKEVEITNFTLVISEISASL